MFARRTGKREDGAMIMAYFERKVCVQRNHDLNCVSWWKGFEG